MVSSSNKLDGSCIYGCKCGDNYVFSTTVESDGRNETFWRLALMRTIGDGINDNFAHLIIGNLNRGFKEIFKEKKDFLPFLFQFGAFKFPSGDNKTNRLYLMPTALRKIDLCLIKKEL